MQNQERELIEGLYRRLKAYESQPRDPEADRLIAGLVAAQPGAPYLLTQTVLVQEEALKAAQARIAELEAKTAAAPPPSFLGSAPRMGPWGAAPASASPPVQTAAPGGPWQQQAPQQQPAGGGFLRSAMTTAAGVAGGALLFEGIRSMFGHSTPFGMGSFGNGGTTIVEENNYISSPDSTRDDSLQANYNDDNGSNDSGFDSAGLDDGGFDNSGGSDDDIV